VLSRAAANLLIPRCLSGSVVSNFSSNRDLIVERPVTSPEPNLDPFTPLHNSELEELDFIKSKKGISNHLDLF
jgi:hypothetical protein